MQSAPEPVPMLDFSLIVVSYRSERDLPALIASVEGAAAGQTWHLTVVDNAGEDLATRLPEHPRVTVVDAGGNLGYSGGLNVGLGAMPKARWVVFLNPDLRLRAGALEALQSVPASVGATVPRMLDGHGVRQNSLRREPTLLRALGDALCGDRWPGRPSWLSETVRRADAYAVPRDVDWATGAALAVRADVVSEVGPWDEQRFFMYSEETDYARRIRHRGVTVRYLPEAVVEHDAGGSGSSPQLDALLEVNKARYYRKWHGRLPSTAFGGIILLRNLVRPHRPGSRAAVQALISRRARTRLPGGGR